MLLCFVFVEVTGIAGVVISVWCAVANLSGVGVVVYVGVVGGVIVSVYAVIIVFCRCC